MKLWRDWHLCVKYAQRLWTIMYQNYSIHPLWDRIWSCAPSHFREKWTPTRTAVELARKKLDEHPDDCSGDLCKVYMIASTSIIFIFVMIPPWLAAHQKMKSQNRLWFERSFFYETTDLDFVSSFIYTCWHSTAEGFGCIDSADEAEISIVI